MIKSGESKKETVTYSDFAMGFLSMRHSIATDTCAVSPDHNPIIQPYPNNGRLSKGRPKREKTE
jgi:hypothetical protein